MVNIDVSFQGEEQLQHAFNRLSNRLMGPEIAAVLEGVIKPWQRRKLEERFSGEHGPTGKAWVPLSEPAQAERLEGGYGADHPILQREGDLMQFITEGGDVSVFPTGASVAWPGAGPSEVQEKYVVNQWGTMDGRHHFGWRVPARPMVGFVPEDMAEAMALLEGWVWEGLAA